MKIIDRKTLYDGFFKLYQVTVEDQGKELKREVFVTGNAVAALLFDTVKEKYILVKQFRPAVEKEMLELVAGILDKEGESQEDAVKREIEEETGYAVDSLEHIIDFHPSPGAFAEKLHIYYAQGSHKIGKGGGVEGEHENIKLAEFTREELKHAYLGDAKTIIAVQWAQLKGLL